MDTLLTPESLKKYLEGLPASGVSYSVIQRKVRSIQRYIAWAHDEGIITSEVYNSLTAVLVTHKIRKISFLRTLKNSIARSLRNSIKNLPQVSLPPQTPSYYAGIAMMLIIMAILGAGIYSQLFKQKVTSSFAYPVTPTRGTRILSFQGRLTDTLSNPITATTDVTFKLYNVSSGGSPLYTGACTGGSGVDPDNDGIFNILIGSDCGMTEIPASVFTDNANVYLGITVGSDSEMSPRQQIANVGYALNSETLQGLPPGKNTSMIPYINDQGDVLIAASAPGLRSTYASATFTISSANAVTLASAGSGDITLNASQSGTLKFQTGGTDRITVVNNGNIGIGNVTNPSAFNVQVAGHVGPNATDTYDLGSVSKEWRNIYGQAIYANGVAVCDANGNNCLNSGWTDDGSVVRLTTSTDKVGIGTTNAVSKLHVTGAVTGKVLAIFDETGDQGLLTASASGVTKFLVDHAGNVGIGVTNPAAKLDIKSGGTNSDVLKLIASDGSRLGRFTETSGGAGWFEVDDAAGTAQALFRGDGAASYLLSGNFGIGTTSPVETLDVRGNASVSGNVVLAGSSRALQSTNFTALTIGGSTTGSILLNPNNGATGGLVAPTTTNVTDLGNSAQQFRNIYGQNLFVNGVAVCDANGNNCPSSSGAWTYSAPYVYPTASATRLGIGTTTTASMISQLYITRTLADGALGKALAIFNQTENQDLFTASASGTPRFTVTNAGNLQFHQASSITTTTGNLTLDSTGGTTTVSDNLVVTGTSDLQGAVANSTGNVVLNDTTDIGSSANGLRVDTAGNVIDINGNIVLNDVVDIGSATTGLNVTTAGLITDTDGNVVIGDTVDLGSATTGINITTAGAISDTDGNISLNDSTDITGSLTLTGTLSDSNSDVQVNDNLDPNTDATFDLGDTTTSWNNLYLTGQICFDDTDCFSASPGNTSGWTDDGTVVRLTTATDQVGIGTTNATSKLHVTGKITGKALAIFDETGDQALLTASASGTPRLTILNDGTLQFHQASSITTTTGNLTLNSTGGTTTVSDNLVVTGTTDHQGAISSSTGNLVLDDTTDIGSATTGVNVTTAGALSDTDGNLVLNDTTDIGSAATGINVTTAGALSDIDGNLVLNDTVDIGSSANGLRVDTAGNVIDINGNIVLNDVVDIGSATTGLNVTTAGLITDTDGNVVIGDTVDLGSASTGINITTAGVISDTDGNISLNDSTDITGSLTLTGTVSDSNSDVQVNDNLDPNTDATFDLGDTTTSWNNLYLTGQICFDDTDCFSASPGNTSGWTDDGTVVRLTTATDQVGIGTASPTSLLHVVGKITGKALAIFDETGDQDLLTASASGVTKFTVSHAGDLTFAGTTGLVGTGNGAGLNFSGTGTHTIQASGGTLSLGAVTLAGTVSGANQNISSIGNITANSSSNTITGFGTIGTTGTTVFNGTSATLNGTGDAITLSGAGANINFSGAGTAQIKTAASQHLALMTGGNVGIGTTTPLEVLDVRGNATVSGNLILAGGSRAIQTTAFNALTLGGSTTGSILLNPNNGAAGGLVAPTTTNVTDLGNSAQQFRNLYAQNIFQNGNGVCDSTGNNCPSGAGTWTLASPNLYPTQSLYRIGIGTTTTASMISQLYVTRTLSDGALGKALAIFNQTENQDLFTASASGTPRFTVTNAGNLQFHQASSITTTTGNLTLDSTGGTTTVSDNLVVTGTSDLQGAVANSTGNVVLNDTTDIGSASTGINVTTAGALSDIDANLVLNDTTDIGSASTGINVTTAGAVSDIDGNLVLNDTVDIGSSANGLRVDTAGNVIDINGNIVLNDVVDIGSATTGLNVTTAGLITDTDGNVVIGDTVDLGSATTGINITTAGAISDTDGNISLNDSTDITGSLTLTGTLSDSNSDVQVNDNVDPNTDATFDLGDTTTSWRDFYLTGQICFDDTDCFSSSPANISGWVDDGTVVRLSTATDQVGIGTTIPTSKLHVTGKITGKALTIFDETGDQALLTASASGVTKFTVSNGGDITFAGTTGLSGTGNGAGLNFSGTGTHTIQASAGTLAINAFTLGGTITGGNNNISSIGNITANSSSNTITGFGTIGTNGTTAFTGSTLNLNGQITSTVSTGTAPMVIASTTKVTNLNADLLDGIDSTGFCQSGGSGCPTGLYVDLQASTPGSQQTGNINVSGAILGGYFADTSNTNYGVDPAGTSNFGGYSLKVTGGSLLALDSGQVGVGIGSPVAKLHVNGAITGKALAMFNETGDQALFTASASGTPRLTILNDGTLQFHQASSITTTTGNLTLNSTGGTTTVSDNLVVTGTTDHQAAISSSTGNLVLDDTTDIGSAANGLRVDTAGNVIDINGNIVLNDVVDLGSASTGINITTAGVISDADGNISLNDSTDVTGSLTLTGTLSDSNSDLQLNDNLDPNTDATFDIGDTTTSWRDLYLTGQICFDDTDCFSASPSTSAAGWTDGGANVYLTTTTDRVGIGTTTPVSKLHTTGAVTGKALAIFDETGDQNLLVASASGVTKFTIDHNGNVGIGSTNNAGKLTLLQTGSGSTDGLYITNSLGNSGRGYLDSSSNLRLQTGTNNSQLVLHNGGNVGIGTTNPQAMLSVGSTSQFQVNSSGNLTSINGVTYSWPGSQGGASTVLTNNGSGTLTWAAATSGTVTGTGSAGQATFWTGTSAVSGDNSFWWDNTDKLFGLGTNAPVAKLHLDGAVKGKALAIFNETGDQDVFTASASGTPVFTVKHNGNVGIGTTAPTAKLEIAGTTSTISNTAGNINITPTSDLVVTSGNVGIGASPVSGGKLYLDTTNSNTINTVTMNIGNTASTTQNNWNTLNIQNGGTGFLDLELVRGFVNNQGINEFTDDFTGDSAFNSELWQGTSASGTGASCTVQSSVVGGVARMTTGTTSGSSCRIRSKSTAGQGNYQQDNNPVMEVAVKAGNAGNTQRLYFGLANNVPSGDSFASTRQALIGKRTTDTNWQCIRSNGTTQTFTDIGVAVSTSTYQRLRIHLSNGTTPQLVCSVDGTAVSVTTNLPGTGQLLDALGYVESTGTSANHDVDYFRVWQDDPPEVRGPSSQTPVSFDATQRADIAERYLIAPGEHLEAGDVVSVANGAYLKKSAGTYDQKVLGIVSTNPDQVLGMIYGDNIPLALNGRVPVKVTSANGAIRAGDYLTASSIPGVAMKANAPGVVIAKALEDYTSNDPNSVGKILAFVNLAWYDPQLTISSNGDMNIASVAPVAEAADVNGQNQQIKGASYKATSGNQILTNVGGFAKVVTGTLSSGLVETQNAIVNGVLTAKSFVVDNITAVNQSVGTLTANAFTAASGTIDNLTVTQKITSPVVETQEVKTETIKPKNDSVVIDLSRDDSPTPTPEGNGKLAQLIIKGLEGKTVATIDSTGNATFSGTVTAKDASVSGQLAAGTVVTDNFGAKEASIAGTVKAKEIQADTIRGSQIDNIESNISKNDQAVKELSGNVNDIQKLLAELKDQPLPDASYYQNLNQPVSASGSGQLQSNAGEAIFEKLSVTGYTILADAYVTNTFAAGDVQISGDSVISLASELKLSALNSINLFDGVVTIARDGSITTRGEVIAQGGVRTNDIKAVHEGEDIKVTLSKGTNTGTESNAVLASASSPKLKIQDGTGNEVASIDASGSAKFRDLALDQYLEATASSAIVSAQDNYNQNGLYAPAITTNGKTIGVGTLPANSNVIAIYNEKVSDKSLIYVTPTSPTDNKTLYIAEKVSCTDPAQNQGATPCRPHFTIAISGTVPHDIQFNWWIVN